jgi:hypothetical protein
MAEFVKKMALGYKAVPGGYSDGECSHVILTKTEYENQNWEIKKAERNVTDITVECSRQIRQAESEAERKIKAAEETSIMQISEMKRQLEKEQEESAYQRRLNENLLRINRERANADRKLKPKKGHTGYVVVNSKEYEYKYREDKRTLTSVMLWQTILESPYKVKFSVEQARKQMYEELFKNHIIGKIGVYGYWDIDYENMIENELYKTEYIDKNIAVKYQLQANYKTGFWEIIILHTKPLENVPDDMMRYNYS